MDILIYLGIFVASLAVLIKGADWLIDSAEEIGLSLGIPQFIIGLTIIAFGTSLPELAASIASVLKGESEIVVSTIVGSNITNIALILGLVAVSVKGIKLETNIWKNDMPHLWAASFLFWFLINDLRFSLFEAFLSLAGIAIFLAYSLKPEETNAPEEESQRAEVKTSVRTYVLLALGGAMVWLGANYTIFAIRQLSSIAGIGADVIALSAVALGTSLPEVIVSLSAAKKGKTSIAVGNVLGSNIFNIYVVMGIPAFFGELVIPLDINQVYLPLMIVMTILFGIMANNRHISRWEGMLLLLFYLFFITNIFTSVI